MNRPLDGIRVVALEQYMSGPYCSMLLADAGAEVIKIERPGLGDPRRLIPPFAEKGEKKKAGGFMAYNRNKKSLALNIGPDSGKKVFLDLVEKADVVYTDVWTSMGNESEKHERLKVFRDYQVNEDLVSSAKPEFLFMHDMPAHRGEEISHNMLDHPNSVVYQQAENRLHAQKALIELLLEEIKRYWFLKIWNPTFPIKQFSSKNINYL